MKKIGYDELIKAMNSRDCHSCFYRHRMCKHTIPDDGNCKHWKLGKCYTCKFINADEDEWYKRGCESECFGGCRKHERDWKKTFELIKIKF